MNALTWIIEVAGKIFPKNSPCARPTFSESAALIMYIRVRTTSANPAPACSSARSIFFSVCTACAYASPPPTIFPCASVAVVPDTHTFPPTRTAREYPITGSQGVPLEIFVRTIKFLLVEFRPNQFPARAAIHTTDQIAPAIPPAQSDTNRRACQTRDNESAR